MIIIVKMKRYRIEGRAMALRECVLEDKPCIECGECNICDLDRGKVCDNCGQCIDIDSEYKSIEIDEFQKTGDRA